MQQTYSRKGAVSAGDIGQFPFHVIKSLYLSRFIGPVVCYTMDTPQNLILYGGTIIAKKEITSRPGLFGTVNHYDSKGKKIGKSRPGLFGSTNHYDANGKKVGSSQQGAFGSSNHYDARGRKVGSSQSGAFSTDHYGTKGGRIGKTTNGFLGSKKTKFDD